MSHTSRRGFIYDHSDKRTLIFTFSPDFVNSRYKERKVDNALGKFNAFSNKRGPPKERLLIIERALLMSSEPNALEYFVAGDARIPAVG